MHVAPNRPNKTQPRQQHLSRRGSAAPQCLLRPLQASICFGRGADSPEDQCHHSEFLKPGQLKLNAFLIKAPPKDEETAETLHIQCI